MPEKLHCIIKETLNPLRDQSNTDIVSMINMHANSIREIQNLINGDFNNIIGDLQDIQGMIDNEEAINKISKVIKEIERIGTI